MLNRIETSFVTVSVRPLCTCGRSEITETSEQNGSSSLGTSTTAPKFKSRDKDHITNSRCIRYRVWRRRQFYTKNFNCADDLVCWIWRTSASKWEWIMNYEIQNSCKLWLDSAVDVVDQSLERVKKVMNYSNFPSVIIFVLVIHKERGGGGSEEWKTTE